ncbi:MAG: site-specific integrase [Bacteroidetes bacterium]|nr:site-specific integrase [Bacteroidota bacterium]
MEKSFGLYFYLRKPKDFIDGDVPIYLRITINGSVTELSTKRRYHPSKWNKTAGRAEGKTEEAKSLNAFLDVIQQKVYETRRKLMEDDRPITAENIKIVLQGGEINDKRYMLMEIFQKHNEQMASLVGREFAPATLTRHETSYRHTLSFLQWKYKVSDIDILKLDYEFISDYEYWLKSTRKCEHNTTIKYLSNLRKIVNKCVRSGWLQRDPFLGFKMTKREVERTALTQLELDNMFEKQFQAERLNIVKDIFLFSCYTGLAYADVKKLKQSEVVDGIDSKQWLVYRRMKTDTVARIPLLPISIKIMQKYKAHPICMGNNHLLPVFSNQRMNAYLKEIADLCGISKTLTYHIARHTFATTITLSNGVPIETVSKMLGHRNLKTTQHYAKILDRKISDDMKLLCDKLSLASNSLKI